MLGRSVFYGKELFLIKVLRGKDSQEVLSHWQSVGQAPIEGIEKWFLASIKELQEMPLAYQALSSADNLADSSYSLLEQNHGG